MNKKGFTLVEVIVVIAIVAIASALVGTQFFSVLGKGGKADKFEDEVLAKSLAEAAYVLYDSKDNTTRADGTKSECITGNWLIYKGYISTDQGLLTKFPVSYIKRFAVHVRYNNNEKITTVYKSKTDNLCTAEYNCCAGTNQGEIIDY